MKHVGHIAVVALVLLNAVPLSAVAQNSDMIAGQVTKVDESAQKVTIKHGPIKKLGMDEGKTMVFRAADGTMLKGLKPGDKIRFAPEQVNGQFTVTKIEKAK